jgi:hypothetical protein
MINHTHKILLRLISLAFVLLISACTDGDRGFVPIPDVPEEEKPANILVTGGGVKGPLINAEVNIYKFELDKGAIHEFNVALKQWFDLLEENQVSVENDSPVIGSIPAATIINNLQQSVREFGFTTELKQLRSAIKSAGSFAEADDLVTAYVKESVEESEEESEFTRETNKKLRDRVKELQKEASTLSDYQSGVKLIKSLTEELAETDSFSSARAILTSYRSSENDETKVAGYDKAINTLDAYRTQANTFSLSAIRTAFKNEIYDVYLPLFEIQNQPYSRQNIIELDSLLTDATSTQEVKEDIQTAFEKEADTQLKSALSKLHSRIVTVDDFKFDIQGRESLYHNYSVKSTLLAYDANASFKTLFDEINALFSENLEPALRNSFIVIKENAKETDNDRLEVKENLLSFGLTNEQGLLPNLRVDQYRGFIYMEVKALSKTVDLNSGRAPIINKMETVFHTDDIIGNGALNSEDKTVYFLLNGIEQRDSEGKFITDRTLIKPEGSDELLEVRPMYLATPLTQLGLAVMIEKLKTLKPFQKDLNLDGAPDQLFSKSLFNGVLTETSDLIVESLGIGMQPGQNIFKSASIRTPELKYNKVKELEAIQHRYSIENFASFLHSLHTRTNKPGVELLALIAEDLVDDQLDAHAYSDPVAFLSEIPEYFFLLQSDLSEKFLADTSIPVSDTFYVMNDELITTQPEFPLSGFSSQRNELSLPVPKGGRDSDGDGVLDNEDQAPLDALVSRLITSGYPGIWSVVFDATEYGYMPFNDDFIFSLNKQEIEGACTNVPCMGLGNLSAAIEADYVIIQAPASHDMMINEFSQTNALGFNAFATVPGNYLVKARFSSTTASEDDDSSKQVHEIIIPIQVIDPKSIDIRFNPEVPEPGKIAKVQFKATKALCALYSFCDDQGIDLTDDVPDYLDISLLNDVFSVNQTIQASDDSRAYTSVEGINANTTTADLSNLSVNDRINVTVRFSAGSRDFIAKTSEANTGGTVDSDSDGIADTVDFYPDDANCHLEKDGILDSNLDGEFNNLDQPLCFASFFEDATLQFDVNFLNETWHYKQSTASDPSSNQPFEPSWHYIVRKNKFQSGFNGLIVLPTLQGTKQEVIDYQVDNLNKRVYLAYKNGDIDYFALESQKLLSFYEGTHVEQIASLHMLGQYLLVEFDYGANTTQSRLYRADGKQADIRGDTQFPKPGAAIRLNIDGQNILSATNNQLAIDWRIERQQEDQTVTTLPARISNDKVTLLSGQTSFGDVIKLTLTYTDEDDHELVINKDLFVMNFDAIAFLEESFNDGQPITISLENLDESVFTGGHQRLLVNWYLNNEQTDDFRFTFSDTAYPFILDGENLKFGDMVRADVMLNHGDQTILVKQLNATVLGTLRELSPIIDEAASEINIADLEVFFSIQPPTTNLDFFNPDTFKPVWLINGSAVVGENGMTFPQLESTRLRYGDRISVNYNININGSSLFTDDTLVTILLTNVNLSEFSIIPEVAELGQSISLDVSRFTADALQELMPIWRINGIVDDAESGFTYPARKLKYADVVELLLAPAGSSVNNAFRYIAKASIGVNLTSLQQQLADPDKDLDSDGDGIPNHQDFFRNDANCSIKTDGHFDDLDGDGITDLDELAIHGTNPHLRDTDNDGLDDFKEIYDYQTNPLLRDTDGDGYRDGTEVNLGTKPLDNTSPDNVCADNDFDGLCNEYELNAKTKVNQFDTDGDGLSDWFELTVSLTDPLVQDTDGDGLSDGLEVRITETDPLLADTDQDGLPDGQEVLLGLEPTLPDTDGNGIIDADETGYDFSLQLTSILFISDLPYYKAVSDNRKTTSAGTCYKTMIADHEPQIIAYTHEPQISDVSKQEIAFGASDWAQVLRFDAANNQFVSSIELSSLPDIELTALEYDVFDSSIIYLGFSDGSIHAFDAGDNKLTKLFTAQSGHAVTVILDQGDVLLVEQRMSEQQMLHSVFGKNQSTAAARATWTADYSYQSATWLDNSRSELLIVDPVFNASQFIREIFDANQTSPLISTDFISSSSNLSGPVFVETIESHQVLRFGSGHAYNLTSDTWLTQLSRSFTYGISHQSHSVVALKNASTLEMTTLNTLNGDKFWRFTTALEQPEFLAVVPAGYHLLAISKKQTTLTGASDIAFQRIILGDENQNALPDWWERLSGLSTSADFNNYQLPLDAAMPDFLNGDPDLDTNTPAPVLLDSDNDGICDHWEVNLFGTNPLSADTDNDGARDEQEIGLVFKNPLDCNMMPEFSIVSDPLVKDSDGDGLLDGYELFISLTNPLSADSDGDGLNDFVERNITNTDPMKADSNVAGKDDGDLDSDGDGLLDAEEIHLFNTNHLNRDTDGDGLDDFDEIFVHGSNPSLWDGDADLIPDFIEVLYLGSNPSSVDSDGDGLSDRDEVWLFGFSVDENGVETGTLLQVGISGELILNTRQGDDNWPEPAPFESNYEDENSPQDKRVIDLRDVNDKVYGRLYIQYLTDPLKVDTDDDGVSDFDEVFFEFSYPDSVLVELSDVGIIPFLKSDPNNIDSDGDGICDYWEVTAFSTNPAERDTDFDGLDDARELGIFVERNQDDEVINVDCSVQPQTSAISNPVIRDTDEDGVLDGDEVNTLGTDPRDIDSNDSGISDAREDFDADGLTNEQELYLTRTHPFNPDSNDNGILDALDDQDGDGLTNIFEITVSNTDPLLFDTNGNGLSDKEELDKGLNPLKEDTDDDGISDVDEIARGTDPLNPDSDNDGSPDGEELIRRTDPLKADSDHDLLKDGLDDFALSFDADRDGIPDGVEVLYLGTAPRDIDTDKDGLLDSDEVWVFALEVEAADNPLDPPVVKNSFLRVGQNKDIVLNSKQDHPSWPDPIENGLFTFEDNGLDRRVYDIFDHNDSSRIIARLFIQKYSDPAKPDTDGDGLTDATEFAIENKYGNGFDLSLNSGTFSPTKANADNFKVSDPWVADTDMNGIPDSHEDIDGDLLINILDQNIQETDVLVADTDGDGIPDGIEVLVLKTNPASIDTDNDGIPDRVELKQFSQSSVREVLTTEACLDTENRISGIVNKDYCVLVDYKSYPTLEDSDNDGTPDRVTRPDSSVILDHFPLDPSCSAITDGFDNTLTGREQCFSSWMSEFGTIELIKSAEWVSSGSVVQAEVVLYSQGWDKVIRYNILSSSYRTPVAIEPSEEIVDMAVLDANRSLYLFYQSGRLDRVDLESNVVQTMGTFVEAGLTPSAIKVLSNGDFVVQYTDEGMFSTLVYYAQNGQRQDTLADLQIDMAPGLFTCDPDSCSSVAYIYAFERNSEGQNVNVARIELDLLNRTFNPTITYASNLAGAAQLNGPIRLSENEDKLYLASGQILELNLQGDADPSSNSIEHAGTTYSEFYDVAESGKHFVGVVDYDISAIPGAPLEPASQNGLIVKDLSPEQRNINNTYLLPPVSLEERILGLLPYSGTSLIEVAVVSRLDGSILIENLGVSDRDGDGMPSIYEIYYGLNPDDINDKFADPDADGLVNIEEYLLGSDPLSDKFGDPDKDGLPNIEEFEYGTDPLNPDTDEDGYSDLEEILEETDPRDPLSFPS